MILGENPFRMVGQVQALDGNAIHFMLEIKWREKIEINHKKKGKKEENILVEPVVSYRCTRDTFPLKMA